MGPIYSILLDDLGASHFCNFDFSFYCKLLFNHALRAKTIIIHIIWYKLLSKAVQCGKLKFYIIKFASRLVDSIFLKTNELFIEEYRWVTLILQAAMEYAGPVVLDETQPIIIIKDPFSFGLHFCVLDLASLLFNSTVIKTGQEANLNENPTEEREIVVVAKADHAT